jgi:hypothetical protein
VEEEVESCLKVGVEELGKRVKGKRKETKSV